VSKTDIPFSGKDIKMSYRGIALLRREIALSGR
jgi:hypothetical protein